MATPPPPVKPSEGKEPLREAALVLEARVVWGGDACLRVQHLAPSRTYATDQGWLARPEAHGLRVRAPAGATLRVLGPGAPLGETELATSGRLDSTDGDASRTCLLAPGERAEIVLGDMTYGLALVHAEPSSRRRMRLDGPAVVATALAALLTAFVASAPGGHRGGRAGGSELPDVSEPAIAALIAARAGRPASAGATPRPIVSLVYPGPPRTDGRAPASTATTSSPTQLPGPESSPTAAAPATLTASGGSPGPRGANGRPSAFGAANASATAAAEASTGTEASVVVDELPPLDPAELAAIEARERMLHRMRRQVTHLGDCYEELGLSPTAGEPSSAADRARLAACVARRQQLAEQASAGPSTPHGVLEWDVVVHGRAGTAVYQGGSIAVPLSP